MIDAYTREREDGELEAVAIWEIDDGEWEKHNADQMRGFSISVTSTIVGESEAAIELVADAHWYSKDDLLTAFAELNTSNQSASVGHLYQFAYEPDTLIVLQWVVPQLTSVAVGLITNFVYDSLKRLLRKAPPLSKVSMEFTDENDGTTSKFYIETGSVEVLKHAIDSIPAAIAANKRQMQYRDEDENWVSLDE
ncbi:hypothetical protein AB4Y63_09295 [Leifsonia sp. YAF41]|uniref:hypothetical protein n=1 Tax=Leifsonia sp. YAF41 TaxID=3233086 RepID=UPI003F9EADFF